MKQTTNNAELLNSQNNNENSTTNTELVEIDKIPNTPYHIIGNKEHGYSLRFGKYKLSPDYDTQEQTQLHLQVHQWNVILQTILAVVSKELTNQKS